MRLDQRAADRCSAQTKLTAVLFTQGSGDVQSQPEMTRIGSIGSAIRSRHAAAPKRLAAPLHRLGVETRPVVFNAYGQHVVFPRAPQKNPRRSISHRVRRSVFNDTRKRAFID